MQLNDIGELFGRMPGFVKDTVKALPKPVYKIGDKGPGGGTVFFAEGGTYMEVSGLLGKASWNEANIIAHNYKGGGYADWHLPRQSELDLVYRNLRAKNIGNLGDDWHWSSSGGSSNGAWSQRFSDGSQNYNNLNSTDSVRAVRAF
jgi:hypothetical protein